MTDPLPRHTPGPFRADQLRDGDRYELSQGHPIYCAPAGWRHGASSVQGGLVLDSDPAVQWTGTDVGISPDESTLRAPDVVVRTTPPSGDSTWLTEAPPLAVEYAGPGQDEREAAHEVVLRNLLQRRGYASLREVHEKGREEGLKEGWEEGLIDAVLALLQSRGLAVDPTVAARLRAGHDRETLQRWLLQAARVECVEQLFDGD